MNDFIVSILATEWQPDPELPDYNPQPTSSFLITEYEGRQAYLWTGDNPVGIWTDYYVVGEWDTITGAPLTAIHPDYGDFIARFGNNEGRATADKLTALWQGHSQEKLYLYDDTDPEDVVRQLYPDDDSPFGLQLVREDRGAGAEAYDSVTVYNTGDYAYSAPGTVWVSLQDNNVGNAQFGGSPFWGFVNPSGWGWRCNVISEDPERIITARAIAIYSDPECTQYLGTSGAFVDDGDGNYYCECPTALFTQTKEPIYWALLYGSLQEGFYTMETDESEALFWSHDAV